MIKKFDQNKRKLTLLTSCYLDDHQVIINLHDYRYCPDSHGTESVQMEFSHVNYLKRNSWNQLNIL